MIIIKGSDYTFSREGVRAEVEITLDNGKETLDAIHFTDEMITYFDSIQTTVDEWREIITKRFNTEDRSILNSAVSSLSQDEYDELGEELNDFYETYFDAFAPLPHDPPALVSEEERQDISRREAEYAALQKIQTDNIKRNALSKKIMLEIFTLGWEQKDSKALIKYAKYDAEVVERIWEFGIEFQDDSKYQDDFALPLNAKFEEFYELYDELIG